MAAPAISLSSSSVANSYSIWFGRVVWLGVLVNLSCALPAIFAPKLLLGFLNLEPTTPFIWVRFAGLLLFLLSLFYLPAASNLYRYRANAYLAVFSRLAGITFFGTAVLIYEKPRTYLPMGLVDLAFGIVQGILLALAIKHERWA
jgi:zinc transporter ZupT